MSSHSTENRYINSKLFDANRKEFSKTMSKIQTGSGNSQYGTMWIHNPVTLDSIKIKNSQIIPEGYIKGRYIKNICSIYKTCAKCNKEFIIVGARYKLCNSCKLQKSLKLDLVEEYKNIQTIQEYAILSYSIFKSENYKSITEFCKSRYSYITPKSQAKIWKKYNINW